MSLNRWVMWWMRCPLFLPPTLLGPPTRSGPTTPAWVTSDPSSPLPISLPVTIVMRTSLNYPRLLFLLNQSSIITVMDTSSWLGPVNIAITVDKITTIGKITSITPQSRILIFWGDLTRHWTLRYRYFNGDLINSQSIFSEKLMDISP